jgi:hypothetical protein
MALVFGQPNMNSQSITNLFLNFPNPTSTDNIKVIANEMFLTGVSFNSSSVSISNNIINVVLKRTAGLTFGLSYPTDTVLIGQLAPGTYTLYFDLKENTTLVTYDIDTLFFTVGLPTNLKSNTNSDNELVAFPNPTSATFLMAQTFDANTKIDIDVYDLFGQKIKCFKNADCSLPIDISGQPNGTYIIRTTLGDKIAWTRIIKNAP